MKRDTPSGAGLVLGLVSALLLLVAAVATRFTVPYRDDWDLLREVMHAPSLWSGLGQSNNEHLVPIERVLVWLQLHWTGATGWVLLSAALAAQAVTIVAILREIWRRFRSDHVTAMALSGAALLILTCAYQLQSFVFGAAVVFPLVVAFAVCAFAAHLRAMERDGAARFAWTGVAAIAALGAMASTTNGLLVPWMIAAQTAWSRRGWQGVVLWSALGTAGAAIYFTSAHATATVPAAPPPSLSDMVLYGLAFFGSFGAYAGRLGGAAIGGVLLAVGVVVVWVIVRDRDTAPRLEQLCVCAAVFVMVSALLSVPSRAGFGAIQGAQSRYATLTFLYWTVILVAAWSRWRRAVVSVPRSHLSFVVCAAGILAIPAQLFLGLIWFVKADSLLDARQALVTGVHDAEWIAALHPAPAVVYDLADELRARNDPAVTDPRVGRPLAFSLTSRPQCSGLISGTSIAATPGSVRASGQLFVRAREALIVDRDNIVRGLARSPRVALPPRPAPLDVVRAVIRAIRPHPDERRSWIGFVQRGASPYVFVAIDDDRVECRTGVR